MGQEANYDETAIPPYELPELMCFADGRSVRSVSEWPERRREILGVFAREMYGREPPAPEALECELVEEGPTAAGLAIRRQYRMWFRTDRSGPWLDWLVVVPNRICGEKPETRNGRIVCENPKKVPVALFLNYSGNHTLLSDAEVIVPTNVWCRWAESRANGTFALQTDRHGSLRKTTGSYSFPLEMFLARGFAVMGCCYCQISPDIEVGAGDPLDLAWTGVFDLWGPRDPWDESAPCSLGAWAWALSRGLDLAYKIPELDAKKAIAAGYSRLGKTALLAAARDERFAACVPNQTGGGGCPLAKRDWGENVATEMRSFRHWYCPAYKKYEKDPATLLTFDQHLLLASIAPRKLFVQGYDVQWFDPEGEYLACRAASPAWTFLGKKGLPDVPYPADYSTACMGEDLAFVRRTEGHGYSAHDWTWLMDFCDTLKD
jgi:hypothetical protein